MSDLQTKTEIMQVMQSIIKRTYAYFHDEFGISLTESDNDAGELNTLTLGDMTAIIGMGGRLNLLVAFSFNDGLVNALYEHMTAGFEVNEDEVMMFRESVAGETVNTVLGHCTADFQEFDRRTISLTPPIIIDKLKHINRMKNAKFYTQTLKTEFGNMDIILVGSRELFKANFESNERKNHG